MKIDLKNISTKLLNIFKKLRPYGTFSFIVAFLLVYAFLVLRINILNRSEPTDDAVTEKLQSVKRPKIDKDVLSKIQALQDQNVEVQTLFKQARENPFSE